METNIDKRAEEHLHKRQAAITRLVEQENLSNDVRKSMQYHCYHDYRTGAMEQNLVDIDKAIKIHCEMCVERDTCTIRENGGCLGTNQIRKAMEE